MQTTLWADLACQPFCWAWARVAEAGLCLLSMGPVAELHPSPGERPQGSPCPTHSSPTQQE